MLLRDLLVDRLQDRMEQIPSIRHSRLSLLRRCRLSNKSVDLCDDTNEQRFEQCCQLAQGCKSRQDLAVLITTGRIVSGQCSIWQLVEQDRDCQGLNNIGVRSRNQSQTKQCPGPARQIRFLLLGLPDLLRRAVDVQLVDRLDDLLDLMDLEEPWNLGSSHTAPNRGHQSILRLQTSAEILKRV